MVFGDEKQIAIRLKDNGKRRYSRVLIVNNVEIGSGKAFTDLDESRYFFHRILNRKPEFIGPEIEQKTAEQFYQWLLGDGLLEKDPQKKYLEAKHRHRLVLSLSDPLDVFSIFGHLLDDTFIIFIHNRELDIFYEYQIAYLFIKELAIEFLEWHSINFP
jgi:hypothetical protein